MLEMNFVIDMIYISSETSPRDFSEKNLPLREISVNLEECTTVAAVTSVVRLI